MSALADPPSGVPPAHCPECPRCGYDQQGAVAFWHADPVAQDAACPLTGTCSECGLVFDWPDLLVPERTQCPGLFEHARGFDARFSAWWRNNLWMLNPHFFWSRVKLHHVVRIGRILLPVYLAVAFFFIERTMLGLCVLLGLFAAGPNLPTNAGPLDDLVTAIAFGSPAGGFTFPYLLEGVWGWESTNESGLLGAMLAIALMWPVLLLVLPQTRAQAKVRLAHVGRAFSYSLWPLLVIFGLTLLGYHIDCLAFTGTFAGAVPIREFASFLVVTAFVGGVIYLAWLPVWWSCAIITGWKVRQGGFVAALLTFTASLAGVAAFISVRMYI